MKRHLHAAVTIAAFLAGPAVMSVSAQGLYNQTNNQPGIPPGQGLYGPTVNPRNLLVPGAVAYPWAQNLLGAQSQGRYNQQIGQLQTQTGVNASGIVGLQQDQLALSLGGITGRPAFFNNYKQYFLNLNPPLPVSYAQGNVAGLGGVAGATGGLAGMAGYGGMGTYGMGGTGMGGTGAYGMGGAGTGMFNAGLGTSGSVGAARGGQGTRPQGTRGR